MNRGLKIFVGVMILLAVLGLTYLALVKKKPKIIPLPPLSQAAIKEIEKQAEQQKQLSDKKVSSQKGTAKTNNDETKKILAVSQWQKCKDGSMEKDAILFWKVAITEEISAGVTYAKGFLEGDALYPVHVTVKQDAQTAEKTKQLLIAGKMAYLRGTCISAAADSTIVLQAF